MNSHQKLTDRLVRAIPAPAMGHKVTFDADVAGFGIRVRLETDPEIGDHPLASLASQTALASPGSAGKGR